MSGSYSSNKKSIYKYREQHPEVIQRVAKNFYENHREAVLSKQYAKKKGMTRYRQEARLFRQILINFF